MTVIYDHRGNSFRPNKDQERLWNAGWRIVSKKKMGLFKQIKWSDPVTKEIWSQGTALQILRERKAMSNRYQSYEISKFVRRQTAQSEFSHWTHTDKQLIDLVVQAVLDGCAKQGYREGVQIVVVKPEGFFSSLVQLKAGDPLEGEYKARQPGEAPRKSSYCCSRNKLPAKYVEVILYHHDVLAENNEQSCDATWEIISVNASPTADGVLPIPVGALIANHFQMSGGTATHMSNDDFVAQLEISAKFYADKAHCAPADRPTRDDLVQMIDDLADELVQAGYLENPLVIKAKELVEAEYQRRK